MKRPHLTKTAIPALSLLVGASTGQTALAWGQFGHEQINHAAIALVNKYNPALGKCLIKNSHTLLGHAITPDRVWKRLGGNLDGLSQEDSQKRFAVDREEHPTHFWEQDSYFSSPAEAIEKVGSLDFAGLFPSLSGLLKDRIEFVTKMDPAKRLHNPDQPDLQDVTGHGTAPWRVLQLQRLGTEALKQRDTASWVLYFGTMGHYVGDLSMPFHTTLNYDGQANGLRGIHEAVDTLDLPNQGKDDQAVFSDFSKTEASVLNAALAHKVVPNLAEQNVIPETMKLTASASARTQFFLDQFGAVASQDPARSEDRGSSNNSLPNLSRSGGVQPSRHPTHGTKPHHLPKRLIDQFTRKVQPAVLVQLGNSSAVLASLWLSGYEAAGKPNLNEVCDGVDIDYSFALQHYPSPNDYYVANESN